MTCKDLSHCGGQLISALMVSVTTKSLVTLCYFNDIHNNAITNSNHKLVPSRAEGGNNIVSEQAMASLFSLGLCLSFFFSFYLSVYLPKSRKRERRYYKVYFIPGYKFHH